MSPDKVASGSASQREVARRETAIATSMSKHAWPVAFSIRNLRSSEYVEP